jgi:acyl-CoA reductase-like NAD-dependent aldehyde dehydrogenase
LIAEGGWVVERVASGAIQAKLFIAGRWVEGVRTTELVDAYSGGKIGDLHHASKRQVESAMQTLAAGTEDVSPTPYELYRILAGASEIIRRRFDEFLDVMVAETGFVTADARRDVERTIETLLLSGEEAKRLTGRTVPVAADPTAPHRLAFTVRRPVGIVCAITPFNSPLNVVAHKVAPALAAGNGVALKPAAATPLSAGLLVGALLDAGLPTNRIALLHGEGLEVGQWLLESPVPSFYAFTGSTEVGEHILRTIGVRRAQVELGSISSTIVCEDADVETTAAACLSGSFRKAGQVCTSVQRLYVQAAIADRFVAAMSQRLAGVHVGDPRDPQTFIGPVISSAAADRIENWVGQAQSAGASTVSGGRRIGNVLTPTVLTDVTPDMAVMRREVFGPVVCVRAFAALDSAVAEANDTPYGLTAGIFTNDIPRALTIAERMRVGSVHINATSSNRVDLMPFGGIKSSGYGKEGPAYAMHEMTDEILITMGPGHG